MPHKKKGTKKKGRKKKGGKFSSFVKKHFKSESKHHNSAQETMKALAKKYKHKK